MTEAVMARVRAWGGPARQLAHLELWQKNPTLPRLVAAEGIATEGAKAEVDMVVGSGLLMQGGFKFECKTIWP